MFFKTLAKFLLPALVGSGIVVLTMHLTNINGHLLNSLNLLNLKEKPDIDEEEIIPKVEPQPPEAQKPESSGEDNSSESTESSESSQDSSEESTQSQPSSTNTSGTATLEDVIRDCAQIINTQTAIGTDKVGSQSLKNIYHMESTISKLLGAIQQQSNQGTTEE